MDRIGNSQPELKDLVDNAIPLIDALADIVRDTATQAAKEQGG